MFTIVGCILASHDFRLLGIAAIVCGIGSYATLQMLARAQRAAGRPRMAWIAAGGIAFGANVWVTHFVAMLAYTTNLPVAFDLPLTALSLLLAVGGGWLSLACAMPAGRLPAIGAGLMIGTTIGAMHFTGMAAFRIPGVLDYDVTEIAAAWLIGCSLAPLALLRLRSGYPAQGAILLLLAVVGLHLTAMAGITIQANGELLAGVPTTSLAIATAAVGLLVLIVSLGSVLVDIHLERRTQSEDARLRRFADATFEGLFFVENGIVQDVNTVLCRMLDLTREQIVGEPVANFFVPECRALLPTLHTAAVRGSELELIDGEGGRLVVDALARPLPPDHRGGDRLTVIAVRDASERKRAERRIQELAHVDPLTGLANRFLLRDRLMQALAMAERSGGTVAVLCLDLDRFKAVNDTLGHHAGDSLLIEIGNRLRMAVRETDTVARLGGDEFVVVQPLIDQPAAAQALAERLVRVLSEPHSFDGCRIDVTTSIGIALVTGGAFGPETLLKQADLALYRAKQDGRDRFRFFEPEMDEQLRLRRDMERDLRTAIANGEMVLHYQPVFDNAGQTVTGYEALLRWNHPARGTILPEDFVPLAEECGAILPIGTWVLQTACAEAASWPEPIYVAVNLSLVQIRSPDLVTMVTETLARTGLAAGRLELEVTEGVLMAETERTLEVLTALKAAGVRVVLDDFGTGYSSINCMRRFAFNRLKIDRSFVAELGSSPDAKAIVQSIMAMSRSLRLQVTAEGVETDQQRDILQAMGACHLQGYLLGRPNAAAGMPIPP